MPFSPLPGDIMKFFICVIGMVMIIEGLPYFAWPAKMKLWISTIIDMPDGNLRKLGFTLMMLGLLCVYLGKQL